MLDPSSLSGYERKHAALHEAKDHENAIHAFTTMFSKMSLSPGLDIHGEHVHIILVCSH